MDTLIDPPLVEQLQTRLQFEPRSREAGAAVLLAVTDEAEPRLLMTRRAQHLKQHAGEVSFPGGKRDPADASNIVTALREAHEETGLDPFVVRLLGTLPARRARSGLWVQPVVGLVPPDVALVAQPDEIERMFWVPLRPLRDAMPQAHTICMGGQWLDLPCYRVQDEIIWGLTGRILVSLLRRGLNWPVDWPLLLAARPGVLASGSS